MLKQLRFKNWRSLRDTTIELTPITVFIGANSSGKTNIIEGLKFRRDATVQGLLETVLDATLPRILSKKHLGDELVELEFSFEQDARLFAETLKLKFDGRTVPFSYTSLTSEGNQIVDNPIFQDLPFRNGIGTVESFFASEGFQERARIAKDLIAQQYLYRWQILGQDFKTKFLLPGTESGDRFILEEDGRNTILILDLLRDGFPDIYERLIFDFRSLVDHVTNVRVFQDSATRTLELFIYEEDRSAAPTVSMGTSRLLATLTSMYALDMPRKIPARHYTVGSPQEEIITAASPGLLVIEEPDTALNPGILQNFVEILRRFTSDPEKPRQVILTTHNPIFLNYFEPEEVRIVERGDDGYSIVKTVPDHIRDVWLKDGEYGLGEVWMTNSFGGMPW